MYFFYFGSEWHICKFFWEGTLNFKFIFKLMIITEIKRKVAKSKQFFNQQNEQFVFVWALILIKGKEKKK